MRSIGGSPAPRSRRVGKTSESSCVPVAVATLAAASRPGSRSARPSSRVAMAYMGSQLFKEVRTKRNLSYAPGAGVAVYQAGSLGMVSVSAVDPTTTYKVMLDELRRLQSTPLTAAQLAGAKATYLTGVINDAEATDGQANLLAIGELQTGDWRYPARFLDAVRAVTSADVQAFARKNFVNLQTLMLGDPSKLDPALGKAL